MNELCEECRQFDRAMNGGPVSFDVWVVCEHKKDNQPERLNPEAQCKVCRCLTDKNEVCQDCVLDNAMR